MERAVDVDDPIATLRAASLRITKQRIAVLAALRHCRHADAERIGRAVREDIGSISTQAVYDVLTALVNAGLVRRLEFAGPSARFELRAPAHDHLVCRRCGAVADIDRADEPPYPPAGLAYGYRIEEAEVTYRGLCPACAGDNVGLDPWPLPA